MKEAPKTLPKSEQKQAEEFGGSDYQYGNVYDLNDQPNYCDKGAHRSRSEANDTRTGNSHTSHWKKQ